MTRPRAKFVIAGCLLMGAGAMCIRANAQQQTGSESTQMTTADTTHTDDSFAPVLAGANSLGVPLLKNFVSDQKSIWTSPSRLRWADGAWLVPLAAATGVFFATDRSVPPALSTDAKKLTRYSNYGLYSLVGVGGGLYLWSKLSRDDHQRETGILAGEAAINSFAVGTAFKYAFGRERPNQRQGRGNFLQGGASFPSDHSAVAWSIASAIAHEYPGPLTTLAVYGLATAVSASRVMGKQHFPSDVVVGGVIGWLIGRQIYRAHHDPELGGGGWSSLSGNEDGEERRERRNMGSTFVPLDSWVYTVIEKLAALRYVHTEILGLKPWTRLECARLTEEAGEWLQQEQASHSEEAAQLQIELSKEFAYETSLLGGGRNLTARFESVYARTVSISGAPLTDGYHFGQTVSYDFGRPFERGTSGQAGGSFRAAAGPVALYIRAEYQHAPGAPGPSDSVRNIIAQTDFVNLSQVRSGPLAAINRPQILDAYATVNLGNWQIVIGRQSLSWAPETSNSMLWSNNIAPVDMIRLVNPEPFRLPGLLKYAGPVRIDQFLGRLEGHPNVPRPFIYGQKINFKPFPFLEIGLGRTVTIGGAGAGATGNALNASSMLHSYFAFPSVPGQSVPGDNHSEMDWTFYVPKVRNYIVLYGDSYADDDILPVENPPRNPWHPGIYVTRFPGIPKLDFHIQGVSTEGGGLARTDINRGRLNYYNGDYPDGYTNSGNIIGNTVGRDGRGIECWFTYWISPRNTLRLSYGHNTVNSDFIPQGGAWQDYVVRSEMRLHSGVYLKTALQIEHISRFPVLFSSPKNNVTAILEVGFSPGTSK